MADETLGGGQESAQPTSSAVDTSSSQPEQSSSHLDLTSDSLIRIDGKGNPVKLSDYTRGFQSQATKASQEAARLRQQLQQYQAEKAAWERQRQLESQQRAGQGQQTAPDIAAQLESLTYLDGKQAASVVRQIQSDIAYRDKILLAALQTIKQQQGVLRGLNESHVNSSFDGKISKWISDGGYPDTPGIRNLMKNTYLAYEGDTLDDEFPDIFKQHYEEFVNDLEATRQQKLAAQRQSRFVPGKGGNTGPRQPIQLKHNASASEIANQLWDSLQTGNET